MVSRIYIHEFVKLALLSRQEALKRCTKQHYEALGLAIIFYPNSVFKKNQRISGLSSNFPVSADFMSAACESLYDKILLCLKVDIWIQIYNIDKFWSSLTTTK